METKTYLIAKSIRLLAIAFIIVMLGMKGIQDEQIKNLLLLFCGLELAELVAHGFIQIHLLKGKEKND